MSVVHATDDASLSARIERSIRSALFAKQLRSGAFIGSEASLAEQYRVSRMAVRDALRALQAAGVVEIRMGVKGGAWVAAPNPDRVADALAVQLELMGVSAAELIDAQLALEVTAAGLAATNPRPEDLAAIEIALAEVRRHDPAATSFVDVSLDVREAIVAAAHNRALSLQFRGLRTVLRELYGRSHRAAVAPRVIAGHVALAAAIAAGDAADARRVAEGRLHAVRRALLG